MQTNNSNSNRLRRSQNFKSAGHEEAQTEGSQGQSQKAREEREQSSSELLESLKHLNIEHLSEKDREQLRFLSLQYQFHLQ